MAASSGERHMLPGPRLPPLVLDKARELGRNRSLLARGTQAHINVVEVALCGLRGQGADQALREARVVLRGRQWLQPVGSLRVGIEVVNDDQVQIGRCRHFATAELTHGDRHGSSTRNATVRPCEVPLHDRLHCRNQALGKVGVGAAGMCGTDRICQDADADQEGLLVAD
jgi:hypothetical protein